MAISVKSAYGKGLGLFADRIFLPGDRILDEPPFFVAPRDAVKAEVVVKKYLRVIHEKYLELSRSDQKLFLSMHDKKAHTDNIAAFAVQWVGLRTKHDLGILQKMARIAEIFFLNAIPLKRDGVTGVAYAGLFAQACQINHSCSPNAVAAWNDERQRLTVHATRPIVYDEEISVSYTQNLLPREERQEILENIYDFRCSCEACDRSTTSYHVSAAKRARILRLEADLAFYHTRYSTSPTQGPISPNLLDKAGDVSAYYAACEICYLMNALDLKDSRLLHWYQYRRDYYYVWSSRYPDEPSYRAHLTEDAMLTGFISAIVCGVDHPDTIQHTVFWNAQHVLRMIEDAAQRKVGNKKSQKAEKVNSKDREA